MTRAPADAGVALSDATARELDGLLAGGDSARRALGDYPADVQDRLVGVAGDAFVAGLSGAMKVMAALALVGLVIALLTIAGRATHQPRLQLPHRHTLSPHG